MADNQSIAEDGPLVTERLFELLGRIPTGGRQIHEANIVATTFDAAWLPAVCMIRMSYRSAQSNDAREK